MMPRSTETSTATRIAVNVGPNCSTHATHTRATVSSSSGYTTEIGALQPLHFARSTSQLMSGMFSYQVISWPQYGQRERGFTTERSAGQRLTQTFRNEPMHVPKRKAIVTKYQVPNGAKASVIRGSGGGEYRRRRRR